MTSRARLTRYLIGCAFLLATLEVCARGGERYLRAVSHRTLYKEALLAWRPDARVAFLGTSRTVHGIAPREFTACFGDANVRAVNLAYNPARLQLEELTAHAMARAKTLSLVFLELSNPMSNDETPDWPPGLDPNAPPDRDAEDRLSTLMRERSLAMRYHRAFQLDALAQAAALAIIGPTLDGSERYVPDYWYSLTDRRLALHEEATHALSVTVYDRAEPAPPHDSAGRLATMAAELTAAGKEVVFLVPPVIDGEERSAAFVDFRRAVVAQSGRPVWTFDASALPADHFTDETHVNRLGRHDYSCAVGAQAAKRYGGRL